MPVRFCEDCGGVVFDSPVGSSHKCPPSWQVWKEEGEDPWSGRRVFALSAREAAELWTRQEVGVGVSRLAQGVDEVVFVLEWGKFVGIDPEEDMASLRARRLAARFRVSEEIVKVYRATRI